MGTLLLVIPSLLILAFVSDAPVNANSAKELNSLLNARNLFSAEQTGRTFFHTTQDSLLTLEISLNDDTVLETVYDNYKKSFGKSPDQRQFFNPERKTLFKDRLMDIAKHNEKARQGKFLYEKSVNEFTDMTNEEVAQYTGLLKHAEGNLNSRMSTGQLTSFRQLPPLPYPWEEGPENCDWRKRGAVSSVKNQGWCGSCVFFAAAAQLESIHFLYHGGPLLDLSEQEMLDCGAGIPGHYGCDGNYPNTGLTYMNIYGLSHDKDYPYTGYQAPYCYSRAGYPHAKVSNWSSVEAYGNEDVLKEAVRTHGPIQVSLYASDEFGMYGKGVLDAPCKGTSNHMVLVVGYGTENNIDYWIVKNSWGKNWGDNGYIRIRRNYGNMCNIASDPYAMVA